MNAAQKLYASIGGTAVKAALGSLRGWGIDRLIAELDVYKCCDKVQEMRDE